MSGTVWGKFFWGDWANDPALRVCGLAAQGLWMRMLCVAAEAKPVGLVTVGGRALTHEDVARLGGVTPDEAESLVAELERNGVFSRNRAGTIYCRRMVRDEKRAKVARRNGSLGGNPSLSRHRRIPRRDKPLDKPADKSGDISQNPIDQALARPASPARARPPLALDARGAALMSSGSDARFAGAGVRRSTHMKTVDGIDWAFRARRFASDGWDEGWGRRADVPVTWRAMFVGEGGAAGEGSPSREGGGEVE